MAHLQKIRILENERIDKPDWDKIQSFVDDDFKLYNRHFFTNADKWITKGFEVSVTAGLNITVGVDGSGVMNTEQDGENQFYVGESGHADLTATLTNNATNYIHLQVVSGNTGTNATRVFWDPSLNDGAGGEFVQSVDTAEYLDVQLYISTSGFSSDADKIPLATMVTSGGAVSSTTDNRNLYFRLGKGEPFAANYSFSLSSPTEPATSSFTGGDKDIQSLKDWMDLVMTRIKDVSGETYWFKNTSGFNTNHLFTDIANTVITGGGTISYNASNVFSFSADITLRVISTGVTYTIPFASQSGQTLGSDQVAYINLDAQLSGPSSGQRGTSGNRALVIANRSAVPLDQDIYWVAYRDGTKLFVRGARQELEQGEETQLGDGITQDLLTFIGSTGETDNSPSYSDNNYIADGDSLVTALGKLDAALYANRNLSWGFVSQQGSDTTIASIGSSVGICSINATDIAFLDSTNKALRYYRTHGSGFSLIGSGLSIPSTTRPCLAALANGLSTPYTPAEYANTASATIVVADATAIQAYTISGTTWSALGSSYSLSTLVYNCVAVLNATDIAVIYSPAGIGTTEHLVTLRFNGSSWSQVGSDITLGTASSTSGITALNSTDVVIGSGTALNTLIIYRFNGSTWSSVTSLSVTISGGPNFSLASMNDTDFLVSKTDTDAIRMYRFDGSSIAAISPSTSLGSSLASSQIAQLDSRNFVVGNSTVGGLRQLKIDQIFGRPYSASGEAF